MSDAYEKWWDEFSHKKNEGVDWYTACRLAFLSGWEQMANKEEIALQLWKAWLEFSGEPWVNDDYGRTYCFFCVEASPNHSDDCIFVRARSLCEDS